MANVAESMARVASGIATGRRQRSELAAEIVGLTRSRRGEVHSMLDSMRVSRSRTARDQAAEASKVTKARHEETHSLLKGLKASRGRAWREYRREAIVTSSKRRSEVRALLTRFGREMVVRRQHRRELSVAQFEKAAAFMRELTSGVASICDGFAKEGRDRAAAIRGRLAAYGRDRHNGLVAWRASYRSAAMAAVGMAQPPTTGAHTSATQAPDLSAKSGRHPGGNLGHRSSHGPQGGDSK